MKYRPKLNPDVDLKGATPETLARALRLRPRPGAKPVVGVAEPAADHSGDDIAHVVAAGELLNVAV